MRGEREKDRTNDILCMPAQKTTAAASTQKKGAEAAAANKCELDGVDGWMEASWGWDCWRKGGKGGRGGGEREREVENGRTTTLCCAQPCRWLARSVLMNETVKAPRRPHFHVVILRFIIHLSTSSLPPFFPAFLHSFRSAGQAGSAGKERPEVLEVTN